MIDLGWLLKNIQVAPNGCWIWQGYKDRKGYGRAWEKVDGQYKRKGVHRLAYRLLFGHIPDNLCVLHACDNPSCVSPLCLFLGTKEENTRDRHNKGRESRGERHFRAKLTNDAVKVIRRCCNPGGPYGEMALRYGVTPETIASVMRKETWAHVA